MLLYTMVLFSFFMCDCVNAMLSYIMFYVVGLGGGLICVVVCLFACVCVLFGFVFVSVVGLRFLCFGSVVVFILAVNEKSLNFIGVNSKKKIVVEYRTDLAYPCES